MPNSIEPSLVGDLGYIKLLRQNEAGEMLSMMLVAAKWFCIENDISDLRALSGSDIVDLTRKASGFIVNRDSTAP